MPELSDASLDLLVKLYEWMILPGSRGFLEAREIPSLPPPLLAAQIHALVVDATEAKLMRTDHPPVDPDDARLPTGRYWWFTTTGVDTVTSRKKPNAREPNALEGVVPPSETQQVFTPSVLSAGTAPTSIIAGISENSEPILAADRFVRIDHNSGEIKEIKEALDDLEGKTSRSNDLFATQDEKLAVLSELSNLQKLFAGEWLRVGALAHSIESRGVVTYLYHKGKDGIVGNAAWECLKKLKAFIEQCLGID